MGTTSNLGLHTFSEKEPFDYNVVNSNFVKIDAGTLLPSDVKNNLTSTDTDKPLSANQGRLLRDALNYFSLPEGSARIESGSLNDLTNTGFYYSTNWDTSTTPNSSQYGYCVYIKIGANKQGHQLFFALRDTSMWMRYNYNGTWSSWENITTSKTESITLTNVSSSIAVASNLTGLYRNGKNIAGTVYFTPNTSIQRGTILFKLPKPLVPYNVFTIIDNKIETQHGGLWLTSNGNVSYYGSAALSANTPYVATFSYLEE